MKLKIGKFTINLCRHKWVEYTEYSICKKCNKAKCNHRNIKDGKCEYCGKFLANVK